MTPERLTLPRAALAHAAQAHHGHRKRMAAALGVSLNVLRRELGDKGLHAKADALALASGRKGKRVWLTDEAMATGRRRLLAALREGGIEGAVQALGLSRATVYRRVLEYGIARGEWRE